MHTGCFHSITEPVRLTHTCSKLLLFRCTTWLKPYGQTPCDKKGHEWSRAHIMPRARWGHNTQSTTHSMMMTYTGTTAGWFGSSQPVKQQHHTTLSHMTQAAGAPAAHEGRGGGLNDNRWPQGQRTRAGEQQSINRRHEGSGAHTVQLTEHRPP